MTGAGIRPDPQRAARLRRLESRVLTRRGLLTGGVAAGMLAMTGPFAQAGEIASLRVAVPPLDPDRPPAWLARQLRRTLTTLAPDGTLRPGAAVAWDGGGAEWRLWLPDAGTATAVASGLGERGIRWTLLTADVLGVRLPEPDDSWPFRLAAEDWAVAPGAYAWDGPARLTARDPCAVMMSPVATLDLLPLADPVSRLAALRAGEVEAATGLLDPAAGTPRGALVWLAPGVAARAPHAAAAAAVLLPA